MVCTKWTDAQKQAVNLWVLGKSVENLLQRVWHQQVIIIEQEDDFSLRRIDSGIFCLGNTLCRIVPVQREAISQCIFQCRM